MLACTELLRVCVRPLPGQMGVCVIVGEDRQRSLTCVSTGKLFCHHVSDLIVSGLCLVAEHRPVAFTGWAPALLQIPALTVVYVRSFGFLESVMIIVLSWPHVATNNMYRKSLFHKHREYMYFYHYSKLTHMGLWLAYAEQV